MRNTASVSQRRTASTKVLELQISKYVTIRKGAKRKGDMLRHTWYYGPYGPNTTSDEEKAIFCNLEHALHF